MDPSFAQASASNTPVTAMHTCISEAAASRRYTCHDTDTLLALYSVLAATCTIDIASEVSERSEKVLKTHASIDIIKAHIEPARNPSLKERRGTIGGRLEC